jgi:arabinofuranosyltransferase
MGTRKGKKPPQSKTPTKREETPATKTEPEEQEEHEDAAAREEEEGEEEEEEEEDGDDGDEDEEPEEKAPAPKAPRPKALRPPGAPITLRSLWPLAIPLAVLLAIALVLFMPGHSRRLLFAQDVELLSASMSREVVPGGTLNLKLRFKPTHPLDADDWVFVHVESLSGAANPCRMVQDVLPTIPPTRWGDAEVEHTVSIGVATSCEPGRFEIYAGLYNRQTSARLKVVEPPIPDNRVHAGWVDIVGEDADGSLRTLTPKDMRVQEDWALIRPWTPWLLAIAFASAFAAWLWMRRSALLGAAPASSSDEDATSKARPLSQDLRLFGYFLPAIPFFLGILVVLEFVKDDAYISFRYAHNLVTGKGLVFNTGEYLEGFTNFLWVLILSPFEALGWDLFQVCEVLGTVLGITCLVITARFTAWINGERKTFSHLWGAFWLATSPSFVLWAKSGLEQPLSSLLPIAGAFVLWLARDRLAHDPSPEEKKSLDRRYLYAGLLMGAGCMTRPELHLLAILVGLPLVLDAVRARKITRAQWLYVAGILAITIPCHSFRYLYYGTLVPNTFYVKTGTGSLIWRAGIKTLHEMFVFNHTGLLSVVAPLAFANRRRIVEKVTMGIICVSFVIYYVKVGVDEMQWHRLYLPALPFLCVLAALGIQNVIEAVLGAVQGSGESGMQLGAAAVGWAAVVAAGIANFQFTYRELHGFDGHGDLAGTFHPDLGKFLVRHERPGALVAFQDMGSTPYHAPDINFLDFFGLVDKTVAHARHDYGLHAFVGEDADNMQPKYDRDMREYFFKRNPEWAILTIYTPQGDERRLGQVFEKDPTGASLGDAYRYNGVQFALWDDPRFRERYVAVRTWPRSASYYLALWRRKDLWEQTPKEVVLDALPPGTTGPTATFEGGLELLGSELTKQTLERHEAFITTWWKLPGPMPHDTYFFVHVAKEGFQAPGDHVPGDWMYPADRWKAGEILEDRTLFQLPPFVMPPGTYKVYLGVYLRNSGKRLKVIAGTNDDDRVLLGSFEAKTLYPLIHQLIPPTRVDVMRKYPDRIVDPHRVPGT